MVDVRDDLCLREGTVPDPGFIDHTPEEAICASADVTSHIGSVYDLDDRRRGQRTLQWPTLHLSALCRPDEY